MITGALALLQDEEGRWRSRAVVAGVLCAALITSSLVMQRTRAAFLATSGNAGDAWAAGTVVIGDDDSGSALFSTTGLLPGSTGQKCLVVSYTGSLTAPVKLYATSISGSLAPYVDLTIEEGTGGTFSGGCTGFSGASVYSGTVTGFGTASSSYGTGVGSFAPTGSGQSKVYRITYTINTTAPDGVQGASASATLTWESRSA